MEKLRCYTDIKKAMLSVYDRLFEVKVKQYAYNY